MSKELAIHKDTGSAIEVRRTHISVVLDNLGNTDRRIYQVSTEKPIGEYSDVDLADSLARVFPLIAFDIGYNAPRDKLTASFQLTRIMTILKEYYRHYTLSEFKLSFELCAMGELDRYLPRDSQGNPDRKHYQQFNSDYISRVMKAYEQRRSEVFAKAEKVIPKEQSNVSEADRKMYHNAILDKIKNAYNIYKDSNKFIIPDNSEYFLFSWLKSNGWIKCTPTTEEDRKKALIRYIQRAQQGLVKKMDEYRVRKEGTASKELDFSADVNAMRRSIESAFEKMVKEKIRIEDYLKYK